MADEFEGKIDAEGKFELTRPFWKRFGDAFASPKLSRRLAKAAERKRRLDWYDIRDYPLDDERKDEFVTDFPSRGGDCILVLSMTEGATAQIKFDNVNSDPFELSESRKFRHNFSNLYLSNAAQSGATLKLLFGKGDWEVVRHHPEEEIVAINADTVDGLHASASIEPGSLLALGPDGFFPCGAVRCLQNELFANQPATPVAGDVFISRDTGELYICFVAGAWTNILTPSADQIAFTPAGGIVATDVQAAIEELDAEKIADVADVIKDTHIDWGVGADQVSAADIPIADPGGLITAIQVEGALQEIFSHYQAGGVARTLDGDLDFDSNRAIGLSDIITTGPWVDVRAFGATGDGVTDDTATIQDAIDFAELECPYANPEAGGAIVFFPAGQYKITSALTIQTHNINILGAGKNATIIYVDSAAINGFEFGVGALGFIQHNSIKNLSIHTNVVKTAGAAIDLDCTAWSTIEDVRIESQFIGIRVWSGHGVYLPHAHCYNRLTIRDVKAATGIGILVEDFLSELSIIDTSIAATAAYCLAGIDLRQGGGIHLCEVAASLCQNGLRIIPVVGERVSWVWVNNCSFDMGYIGAYIFPAGTAEQIYFDNTWFGSNDQQGLYVGEDGGTTISVKVNLGRVVANGHDGILVGAGDYVDISNCLVTGNSNPFQTGAANTNSGIGIANNVNNFTIINNRSEYDDGANWANTQKYGINIVGAAHNNYQIIGNQVIANVTGGILDEGTGTNKIVKDNLDTSSIYTFAADDATPGVQVGELFRTANANPTTITMFDGGFVNQRIIVIINDANTTIDFTGTNLKGNGGVDWSPASGDWMICVFDGTNWHCKIYDAAQSGYLSNLNQSLAKTDTVQFGNIGIGTATLLGSGIMLHQTNRTWNINNVTLADEATVALETLITNPLGLLWLIVNDGNVSGTAFIRGGNNAVTIVLDPMTKVVNTDTDTKLCILSDGDGTYSLKNRLGASKVITLMFLGF